jgi:hypothetical protein
VFTPVTVTGTIVHPDGSPSSGGLTFQLGQMVSGAFVPGGMKDSSTNQQVSPDPVQAVIYQGRVLAPPVGGGGYNALILYAVDDPTTSPTGSVYQVVEQLTSGGIAPWTFSLSRLAAGGTVDLATLRPVPA